MIPRVSPAPVGFAFGSAPGPKRRGCHPPESSWTVEGFSVAQPQPAAISVSSLDGGRGPPPAGLGPNGDGSNGVQPKLISTGTGPLASFGSVSDIEMLTRISGHPELSATPTTCLRTAGFPPASTSRVSRTSHLTAGTSPGT